MNKFLFVSLYLLVTSNAVPPMIYSIKVLRSIFLGTDYVASKTFTP